MADNLLVAALAVAVAGGTLLANVSNNRVQQKIAQRKLRLDLFEKRYALWRRMNDAIEKASKLDYSPSRDGRQKFQMELIGLSSDFYAARKESDFLFPSQVGVAAEGYWSATSRYLTLRNSAIGTNDIAIESAFFSRIDSYIDSLTGFRNAFNASLGSTLDFSKETSDAEVSTLGETLLAIVTRLKANRASLEEDISPLDVK